MDALPKYIINFDEFILAFKDQLLEIIDDAIGEQYPQLNTDNIESLLEDLEDLLPSEIYEGLKDRIDFMLSSTISGIQKVEGRILDIPPLIKETTESFQFDKDVYITALHVDQTGWKKNDVYSLEANKSSIINKSFTKEIGEHKYFNTYLKVSANNPITFTLFNNSGNSRQTMIDLEYLEQVIITPPPTPPPTPVEIPATDKSWLDLTHHDFDIAVIMNWESNTVADIDLHGFIGSDHVWYKHHGNDDFKLDYDWTYHTNNTNPEVMTVKGHKDSSLEVYVHNYKPTTLTQPVSVKIYAKDNYRLLKEYSITLAASKTYLIAVCSINLSSLVITDLDSSNNERFRN